MKTIYSVFDQLAEVLAKTEPEVIRELKASNELQARFDELIQLSKSRELNKREKDELDHYIVMERLFRLAKINAETEAQ